MKECIKTGFLVFCTLVLFVALLWFTVHYGIYPHRLSTEELNAVCHHTIEGLKLCQ